ncbi:MAG: hypothetical protein U0R51_11175 [Solirubrobacterales bacterium]
MRKQVWILLIVGVLACGLLAAGCGSSDDSSSTEVTVEDTDASTTVSDGDTSVTAEDTSTSSDSSGGATADDVYNACVDAIEGTAAEQAGQTACQQAKDAFEQCAQQAEAAGGDAADTALGICQDAADQAVKQLEAAGG